jgi:copper homeostasis protein
MIRPRGGDFVYSRQEFELMKEDVFFCKSANVAGIVFGILTENGSVDIARCREIFALASPLKATFHRAFDSCANYRAALEEIIALGFERVLTSGGEANAFAGVCLIQELVQLAAGRISIMPGGGINEKNIISTAQVTGASEFHTTAKKSLTGNNVDIDYQTDLNTVMNLVSLLKNYKSHGS